MVSRIMAESVANDTVKFFASKGRTMEVVEDRPGLFRVKNLSYDWGRDDNFHDAINCFLRFRAVMSRHDIKVV